MTLWQTLLLIAVVNTAIWVLFDASKVRDEHHVGLGPRGMPPRLWFTLVMLFLPAGLPVYLKARSLATLEPQRTGVPPKFSTGGLSVLGLVLGILGLALFVTLVATGHFAYSLFGLALIALGWFGGRHETLTGEIEKVDLGNLAFEPVGFRPPEGIQEDDGDDLEEALLEEPSAAVGTSDAAAPQTRIVLESGPPVVPMDLRLDPGPPVVPFAPDADAPPPVPVPPPAPPAPTSAPRPPATPAPAAFRTGAPRTASPQTAVSGPQAPNRPAAPAAEKPGPESLSLESLQSLGTDDAGPLQSEIFIPPDPLPGPTSAAPTSPGGVAFAASQRRRRVWPFIAGGVAVALILGLGAGWWLFGRSDTAGESPGGEPADAAAVEPAGSEGTTSREDDAGESARTPARRQKGLFEAPAAPAPAPPSTPIAERETRPPAGASEGDMKAWIETYGDRMGPVALALDEIDFDGFDPDRCRRLQRAVKRAGEDLGGAPDSEVDALLAPSFRAFTAAAQACRGEDEGAWSFNLLAGKEATHEAQVLLDERYQYGGILELELESAIGEERSEASMSGRFLLDGDGAP